MSSGSRENDSISRTGSATDGYEHVTPVQPLSHLHPNNPLLIDSISASTAVHNDSIIKI